jgi:hypothetical protein
MNEIVSNFVPFLSISLQLNTGDVPQLAGFELRENRHNESRRGGNVF